MSRPVILVHPGIHVQNNPLYISNHNSTISFSFDLKLLMWLLHWQGFNFNGFVSMETV